MAYSTPDFAHKQVVVSGGGGALGLAVVGQLLEAGATVFVPEYGPGPLAIDHPRLNVITHVDLTQEAAVESFYGSIPGDLWASIQIAGGFAMSPLLQTSLSDWQRMMNMNATSSFLCCREAVRKMRGVDANSDDSDNNGGGRLVNVAAKPALHPTGGMVAYGASKAAVANLTLSLAEELAPLGIWVNAIVPSIMDTPANRGAMPDADHSSWPSTDDVARSIVFLASADNAVTRGALVPVYGRAP